MKNIIALTSAILREIRRDRVDFEVKRVFNHIPRPGRMKPDEVLIVPEVGDTLYTCSWDYWLTINA